MTRIYIPEALAAGKALSLRPDNTHHVAQVLRLRAGEPLTLFNGAGGEFAATITVCEKRRVEVQLLRFVEVERESKLEVTLAQCVSKGERMDYAIQKSVELGVSAIVPLLSARAVVRLDAERWEKKLEHWRGVIVAACEQSGRTRLPELAPVQTLEAWFEEDPAPGARLILAPGGDRTLRGLPIATQATLLVGPEGGFEPREVENAARRGFVPLALGPRVLRTETAGVAALTALQALWGDLGG